MSKLVIFSSDIERTDDMENASIKKSKLNAMRSLLQLRTECSKMLAQYTRYQFSRINYNVLTSGFITALSKPPACCTSG